MTNTSKKASYIAGAALGLTVIFTGLAKASGSSDMSWAEAALVGSKALCVTAGVGSITGGIAYCVVKATESEPENTNDGAKFAFQFAGGILGLTAGFGFLAIPVQQKNVDANTSQKVSAVVSPTGETALVLPAARWAVPAA